MQIDKSILFGISLRLSLTWVLLTIVALLWGEQFIRLFLPFMTWVISNLQSEYWPTLSINAEKPGLISMVATTRHSIPGIALEGAKLTAGAHVTHALVPFVIFYCLVIALPVRSFKYRIYLILITLPMNWVMAAATVPFQLTGHIEMLFVDLAKQYGAYREKSILLSWMYFLEVGGRWLIPIITAMLSCLLFQVMLSPKKKDKLAKRTVHRKRRKRT